MATIDDSEIEELRAKLDAFDAAYVDLVQAAQRLLRINEVQKCGNPRNDPPKLSPENGRKTALVPTPILTGDMCQRCGSANVTRTGTCLTCRDCYETSGCG